MAGIKKIGEAPRFFDYSSFVYKNLTYISFPLAASVS